MEGSEGTTTKPDDATSETASAKPSEESGGSSEDQQQTPPTEEEIHQIKLNELLHGTHGGSKKSLWSTTIETFQMADGKDKKKDVYVDTKEEGIQMMYELVEEMEKDDNKYKMELTPFNDFNATKKDLLRTFVQWSYKDDDQKYNISKAVRRLESYIKWMDDNRNILEQEFTNEDKKAAHELWGPMKLTYSKNDEKTLVWWINLAGIEKKGMKDFNHNKSIQYVVWSCHYILFQDFNDVILIENLDGIGMMKFFTLIPIDISKKMDRLTIGVLPIRIKTIYLIDNPRWMYVIITMLKPFMSKKMRQRMITVDKKTNLQEFFNDKVGMDCIPKDFIDSVEGTIEQDEFAKLFT